MRNFIFCTNPHVFRMIKSRGFRWASHIVRMEEGRNAFEILTRKLAGKRPIGMLRHRWEDNI